ncbi:MAG: hypothetical protein L0H53_14600 [Candidatus Nitrosocosmicus sp.]|nr:hypothetical protein [Candidatus Nitrosocosmicus sp.]MDN5867050.1 hypothetical protein [Candidatus Nitrosocosmicus sp.]
MNTLYDPYKNEEFSPIGGSRINRAAGFDNFLKILSALSPNSNYLAGI